MRGSSRAHEPNHPCSRSRLGIVIGSCNTQLQIPKQKCTYHSCTSLWRKSQRRTNPCFHRSFQQLSTRSALMQRATASHARQFFDDFRKILKNRTIPCSPKQRMWPFRKLSDQTHLSQNFGSKILGCGRGRIAFVLTFSGRPTPTTSCLCRTPV